MKVIDHPEYHIFRNGAILSNPKSKFHKPRFIKGSVNENGYLRVTLSNRKKYYLHRLLAIHFIPNPHNYKEVDHINGDTLDNRLENLRWADRHIQTQNTRVSKTNKLGIKNVSRTKDGTYVYSKEFNGEIHKVTFKTLEHALNYKNYYEDGLI